MLADDGGEHAGITIPRPPTTSNHDCRGPPSSNHCGRCITALHAQVRMWKALRAMHVHVLLLLLRLVSEISTRFFGTRLWRDEMLIVSPRLGRRNRNFNPGIETLVVEILIVSPRLGGRNINFNPGTETLESRLLAHVPSARPFPSARPLSAERLFSQCLFHYTLVCYHMLCYILLCCTILLYVVRSTLCPTYAVFYFISCYFPLHKFRLLCYVMGSILLCFALFGYVLPYVISFGSVILCYALVYYIIFPYTEKSLIQKICYTETSLIKGNPL